MNSRALASTGSVLSALASSACCWNSRLRKMNRGMLWVSTALVLTFALFPSYVGHLFAVQPTAAESPARTALAAAVGKAGYSLVAVNSEQSVATEPELAGHWVTELEEQNGEMIEVIMDLGVVNSRWVGEFDLPKYNVMNYPVEVKTTGDTIELFLTAIGMSFKGSISADGVLTGVGQSPGAENEPVSFRRTGPAEFSEGFLELEAAADNPSLVEILSDDGSELRKRFNADSEKTRLVMLLSPT